MNRSFSLPEGEGFPYRAKSSITGQNGGQHMLWGEQRDLAAAINEFLHLWNEKNLW